MITGNFRLPLIEGEFAIGIIRNSIGKVALGKKVLFKQFYKKLKEKRVKIFFARFFVHL